MHLIPQSWAHLHILVSVFPSFGLVIVLGFYLAGFLADNDGIKRTCLVLFAMLALLSIPTFFSGQGSMAALSANPKISKSLMNFHYWWGVAALVVLILTGVAAVFDLLRSGRSRAAASRRQDHILCWCLVSRSSPSS